MSKIRWLFNKLHVGEVAVIVLAFSLACVAVIASAADGGAGRDASCALGARRASIGDHPAIVVQRLRAQGLGVDPSPSIHPHPAMQPRLRDASTYAVFEGTSSRELDPWPNVTTPITQ